MNTLLVVVVDSDVRAKDTEVGKGTPLTSPFIEGIYENQGGSRCRLSHRSLGFGVALLRLHSG